MDPINIKQKLCPAFAGVLVDWKISPKEITATFIDLILRNKLTVIGDKLILSNSLGLRPFEEKFVNLVFSDKMELTFEEVSDIAYKKKYSDLSRLICQGMIDEELVIKDGHKILASYWKKVFNKLGLKRAKVDSGYYPYTYSDQPTFVVPSWGLIIMFIVSILIMILNWVLSMTDVWWKFEVPRLVSAIVGFFSFFAFWVFMGLVVIFIFNMIFKTYENEIISKLLTDKGKAEKKEAIELFHWLKANPLFEDRLGNEFIEYSIAFGIGTNYLNKLGKENAKFYSFVENFDTTSETTMNFLDFNKYLDEFYNPKE